MKRKRSVMVALLSTLGLAACMQSTGQAEANGASQAALEADTEDSSAETDSADLLDAVDSSADAGLPGVFNFETHTVLLNSGYEMPIMGLGTYSLSDEECYNSVTALLEAGGRLIDTAYMYGNDVICCEL